MEQKLSYNQPSNLRLFLVALGTFLLMFSAAVVSNSTTYFIVAVTEYLGVTRAEFAVYYTIVSIGTAVGSILCGLIINKIGIRKAFLIATVGVTAGFLIMSRLNSLMMVYVGALFIGLCQSFAVVPPVAVVNQWFPGKLNGLVIGTTMAGTGAGGIVLAQIMPRVVAYVDWRTGYLICAAMFCVFTLIGNLLCGGKAPDYPENAPSGETVDKNAVKKEASYTKAITSAAFILMVLVCVIKCISSVFNGQLSAHLQDSFSVEQVALAMTVFNVALLIFKVCMGAIYTKIGPKVMLILVFISSFAYWGLTTTSYPLVLASIAILMFTCSTETVCFPLFLSEMFGKKISGAAWGICWGAIYIGNAIGAVAWGAVYDNLGSYNPGLYLNPFIVGLDCILIFAALVIAKKQGWGDAKASQIAQV